MSLSTADANGKTNRDTDWMGTLVGAFGVGCVIVATLGLSNETFGRTAALVGGLLLTGASSISGGFFGFLFGIPRAKQVESAPISVEGRVRREYLENTNLEQISDWLTKIVVGLTLVEYERISGLVLSIGSKYGPVLVTHTNAAIPQAVAVATVVYFFLVGFLFSYLWTRIYMETLLRRQHALLDTEIANILEVREKKQDAVDSNALELVEEFLTPTADPKAEKFEHVEEIISAASLVIRTMIFQIAQSVRRKNWREDGNHELIERCVRVFHGLIKAAPEKYHRNYGQLGYALIKKPKPDWVEAEKALRKAIELRGQGRDSGSGTYEFNLALTLISLDDNFKNKKSSAEATRAEIAALLDIGKEAIPLSDEPMIVEWAELNGYSILHPPS